MRKLLFPFFMLVFTCCNDKYKEFDDSDDFKGIATIKGTLSYKDIYSGDGTVKPLKGKKVFIAYSPSDTANYLYYTITDDQGNFTFNRLYERKPYDLFFVDSITGVRYLGILTLLASTDGSKDAPNNNANILAQNDTIRQNGLVFTVINDGKEPVSNASAGLFNNLQIFQSDSTNAKVLTSISTDAYGRAVFYNYKQGTYYVRVLYPSSGQAKLKTDTSVIFSGKGMQNYTITLHNPVASIPWQIKTMDEQNAILPFVSLCIFNNPDLANSEGCDGSVYSGTSDSVGQKQFLNVPPGTYYILAKATYNSQQYIGKSTVTISRGPISPTNVTLTSTQLQNGWKIVTVDALNSPLAGARLYLFNSQVLFQAPGTAGNIDSTTTNKNGEGSFKNVAPGTYYVKAIGTYGNLVLTGSLSTNLEKAENKIDTVQLK